MMLSVYLFVVSVASSAKTRYPDGRCDVVTFVELRLYQDVVDSGRGMR